MYVKGVGPARAEQLDHKGLRVVEDLLTYAPFRYEDRSNLKTIAQLAPGEMATVMVEVRSTRMVGLKRRDLALFEATFIDGSQGRLVGKWFKGGYLNEVLTPGRRVALFGKIEFDSYTGQLSILHPDYEIMYADDDEDNALHTGRIVPIYEAAGKVTARLFRRIMRNILDSLPPIPDPLPPHLLDKLKLPDQWTSLRALHFPEPTADVRLLNAARSPAHFRLIFEEFFWLECGLQLKKRSARKANGIAFALTDRVGDRIKQMLPFRKRKNG